MNRHDMSLPLHSALRRSPAIAEFGDTEFDEFGFGEEPDHSPAYEGDVIDVNAFERSEPPMDMTAQAASVCDPKPVLAPETVDACQIEAVPEEESRLPLTAEVVVAIAEAEPAPVLPGLAGEERATLKRTRYIPRRLRMKPDSPKRQHWRNQSGFDLRLRRFSKGRRRTQA